MRLFVAIDASPRVREELARVQGDLRGELGRAVRWVPPASIHLTLKFLGEVQEERVGAIRAALEGVRQDGFELRVRGMGCFPDERRAKVLWAGVEEPSGALENLHQELETRLAQCDFEPDTRPFHPHLTLGRSRDRRGDRRMADAADAQRDRDFGTVRVGEVHLYSSRLLPSGAVHTKLHTKDLA